MRLRNLKILDVFIVFIICFLFHNLYKWFPNFIFSVLFPVNESIWEHMKIIFSSILTTVFIDKIFNKNLYTLFSGFFSAISGVIIYLIIYIPIYLKLGENFFISILLLFIIIVLSQIISFYILKRNKNFNKIALLFVLLTYLLFLIFTYFPPKQFIFYDQLEEKYGINIYTI